MWFQSFVEGAEHKAPRLWGVVILSKVRKGSFRESKGTASSIDILVAQAEHDLSEVRFRSFRPGSDHLVDTVEIGGYFLTHFGLHL